MSESSHLISNLKEMMEAYTEVEEESVQETRSREVQEEERVEARREPKGESRKMKRGPEEAKAKKRNEKVRSLILDKTTTLMQKSPNDRGFIAKRGFKKTDFFFL